MKKILIAILMFCCVPMFARGDEPEILDKTVPISRLYTAVQKYNALYDSDFVFFLEKQISDGIYTLGNLARACVNYSKLNSAVTKDTCKNFMNDIIGESQKVDPNLDFIVTTTPDTKKFEFMISAAGDFTVDCGDGKAPQVINKTDAKKQTITCDYDTASVYTIIIGGLATAYSTEKDKGYPIAAISFAENKNLAKIEGTLGAIFPTLDGDSQPVFRKTFYFCDKLTGSIPANLFAGIKDQPAEGMFMFTFGYCWGLTGSIPANLFAGINGTPARSMFDYTFSGCSGLSGEIPAELFAGINGQPAEHMFNGTFSDCSGLTGPIPPGLFAGIKGPPAEGMFAWTFNDCSGLTGPIPPGLFAGIKGPPAEGMFNRTFKGCSGLTGSIPEKLFVGINGPWQYRMFENTFYGCSKLSGTVGSDFFGTIDPPINKSYVDSENIFTNTNVKFQ